jgi:hypothetical protein
MVDYPCEKGCPKRFETEDARAWHYAWMHGDRRPYLTNAQTGALCYARALDGGEMWHCVRPEGHKGPCKFEKTLVIRDGVTREELRAILAPLLDNPFFGGRDGSDCGFCELGYAGSASHAPDCPALEANKNRLLGRSSSR